MPLVSQNLLECWGFDAPARLFPATCQRLAVAIYRGQPLRFCWRYVHYGPALPDDLDAEELRAITGAGFTLLVIQRPRQPSDNILTADLGTEDGQWAVRNAQAAGYATPDGESPLCLAMSLEGVRNPGPAVSAYAVNWASVVRKAGYRTVVYVGFEPGLTPQELYELPGVERFFCAWGPLKVAKRGECCKRFQTAVIAGIQVVPARSFTDALGGVLTGLADATWPGSHSPSQGPLRCRHPRHNLCPRSASSAVATCTWGFGRRRSRQLGASASAPHCK